MSGVQVTIPSRSAPRVSLPIIFTIYGYDFFILLFLLSLVDLFLYFLLYYSYFFELDQLFVLAIWFHVASCVFRFLDSLRYYVLAMLAFLHLPRLGFRLWIRSTSFTRGLLRVFSRSPTLFSNCCEVEGSRVGVVFSKGEGLHLSRRVMFRRVMTTRFRFRTKSMDFRGILEVMLAKGTRFLGGYGYCVRSYGGLSLCLFFRFGSVLLVGPTFAFCVRPCVDSKEVTKRSNRGGRIRRFFRFFLRFWTKGCIGGIFFRGGVSSLV